MTLEGGSRIYSATNAGNGSGSMIGDIAYIDSKDTGVWGYVTSIWDALLGDNNLCFVAGTVIKTSEGERPIEDIQVGDMVWAWDEETGDVSLKQVVETYVNETSELVHVFVCGEEIVTTPKHPFYSPVKGWVEATQLRAGDILVLVNGEYVVVEQIQHEILEVPITVYNFQVEGYHTYFVSNIGVLVHNTCSNKNTTTEWDTKNYSQGEQKVTFQGKSMTAQYDGKFYWLDDLSGHGGSSYKVFTKKGKYLYWYSDADIFGNFISGKHKSEIGFKLKL